MHNKRVGKLSGLAEEDNHASGKEDSYYRTGRTK